MRRRMEGLGATSARVWSLQRGLGRHYISETSPDHHSSVSLTHSCYVRTWLRLVRSHVGRQRASLTPILALQCDLDPHRQISKAVLEICAKSATGQFYPTPPEGAITSVHHVQVWTFGHGFDLSSHRLLGGTWLLSHPDCRFVQPISDSHAQTDTPLRPDSLRSIISRHQQRIEYLLHCPL